jgi:hypothetical protein
VSPPGIGVVWIKGGALPIPQVNMRGFGGGNRLAQVTVIEGFGGRCSMLGRISFPGRRDKTRECRNAKMHHSLRAD